MVENSEAKELCQSLILAEREEDVVRLLRDAGYWNRSEVWRHYGDVENNFGQGANQQSWAEAALAEKIVNAIDARLINECLIRKIDPKGASAPKTIRSAISQFFESGQGDNAAIGGYVEEWSDKEIREIAQDITLCATGVRPEILNITIADCGEGQTPGSLPETILSLSKSNKMYIPFVQGQFNQGGTGALRFCGQHNLQLVISKRNPALLSSGEENRGTEWGFTIVRRERPMDGRRNSVYTYLAPVRAKKDQESHYGEILSFASEKFGISPGKEGPYDRQVGYGTVIKLYEYKYVGDKSNILRGKSLLSRLDLLLPEIALPVRLYEYRTNREGKFLKPGSRETTLLGIRRRLKDNQNVEEKFPVRILFSVQGEKFVADIFAFKLHGSTREEKRAGSGVQDEKRLGGIRNYRKNEGVVFVRNGQTHGHLPKDFFRRDRVKMKPLADDLLVFVNCDQLSDTVREDLFMPSRDRLTDNEFKKELIDNLEKAIRDCEQLKRLRNQRQQERMGERLKDDRPLTDVLQSLIRNSPNLKTLLQLGRQISAPFDTTPVGSREDVSFKGKFHPTYFKTKNAEYGKLYKRECPINQRMRLTFETDVQDDYFTRHIERGEFTLSFAGHGEESGNVSFTGPSLRNGIATVMVDLPDGANIGDSLIFVAQTVDSMRSFQNRIQVTIKPEAQKHSGGNGRREPPDNKEGEGREQPNQLASPVIEKIYRKDWGKHNFDDSTAMKVESDGYTDNETKEIYVFRVNMDNRPLLNEIKYKRLDDTAARNQFLYGNVLVGLSLLLDYKQGQEAKNVEMNENQSLHIEDQIEITCRALAPFLPSLTSLGTTTFSEDEDIEGLEDVG